MSALSRLQKLEEVAACDVPCALHALADATPTPPGAELWEAPCFECGAPLLYHIAADVPRRERELSAELYGPGTLAALTASRRTLAGMI